MYTNHNTHLLEDIGNRQENMLKISTLENALKALHSKKENVVSTENREWVIASVMQTAS